MSEREREFFFTKNSNLSCHATSKTPFGISRDLIFIVSSKVSWKKFISSPGVKRSQETLFLTNGRTYKHKAH